MRSFEFIPSLAQGEGAKFSGKLVLRVPNFDERFGFFEECGFVLSEEGALQSGVKQMGPMRKMVSLSEKFYVSVDLKKLETGDELKSFEDLSYDQDCTQVLIEAASALINGAALGKKQKPE